MIPAEKLRDYLLSRESLEGRSKAQFLELLGYTRAEWRVLEAHLRSQILPLDAEEVSPTKYGRKFIIRGPLTGPSDKTAGLITVWIIPAEDDVPRFVSAYPAKVR
jgi:hypothetical protein